MSSTGTPQVFRGALGRPSRNSFENHAPHRTDSKTFYLFGDTLQRRHFGFRIGLGGPCRLVPYHFRINDGRFARHSIHRALRSRNTQIAHAQERVVFFHQERSLGMGPQKLGVLPALGNNFAQDAEHKRTVGCRIDGNIPIGLRYVGVVLDIDGGKLCTRLLRIKVEVHHALAGNGRIAAPDDNMVGATPFFGGHERSARTEHLRHSRLERDVAIGKHAASAHDGL